MEQSKTKVNSKATTPMPNQNKDESKDLTPSGAVVSPDDKTDLGKNAAVKGKVTNPFPNMGDPKKIKTPSLETINKKVEEELEVDFYSDIKGIFESQELDFSDEFYKGVSKLMEAAVDTKMRQIVETLINIYDETLQEELLEIKEALEAKVDAVLTESCDEWQSENELAIQYGIRNELSENLIKGMRDLFVENYVDVPEEKYDLVESLELSIDEYKSSFSELYEDNVTLKKELDQISKHHLLFVESADLSDFEAEKLFAIAESILDKDYDYFESKIKTIKENHFSKYKATYLTEDVLETDSESLNEGYVDQAVAQIATRLV